MDYRFEVGIWVFLEKIESQKFWLVEIYKSIPGKWLGKGYFLDWCHWVLSSIYRGL